MTDDARDQLTAMGPLALLSGLETAVRFYGEAAVALRIPARDRQDLISAAASIGDHRLLPRGDALSFGKYPIDLGDSAEVCITAALTRRRYWRPLWALGRRRIL